MRLTIDSGACDAVCPPHSFSNTSLNVHNKEFGKPYGACGGETVRNIGSKAVTCLTNGGVSDYVFQVGDKLTKPLLAVSKICEQGKAVFFGPGPAYESYIVSDPNAFVISEGGKTRIQLENGTYHIDVHECSREAPFGNRARHDLAPISPEDPSIPPVFEPVKSDPYDSNVSGGGEKEGVGAEGELEIHDDIPVKTKPNPLKPTAKQVEEHIARGHVPFRSWCEQCVSAGAKEDPHHRIDHSEEQLPVFTCDYCFMGGKDDPDKITVFVLKECVTRSIYACICLKKGSESQIAAELFIDAIAELGFKDAPILYKCDQEPALLDIVHLVSRSRAAQTSPENSPVGQSKSNGSIENAVHIVETLIRRLRGGFKQRLKCDILFKHM